MIAPVNKIIDHSVVDGPGNRTAVFFQGCPFRCQYCHNPETMALCTHCGACVSACPAGALSLQEGKVHWEEALCVGCDSCLRACPHLSSPKVKEMTVEEILLRIQQNRPFIRGITCSGGECTLYAGFMAELFAKTKAMGLTNLIDSNGILDFSQADALLEHADGVMLDIKCFDRAGHIRLTGKDNDLVLQNAAYLARRGLLPEVRTVIIPGVLPNEETVALVSRLLAPYQANGPIRYKLIAFRPMGVREEFRSFPVPSRAEMESLAALAREQGMADVAIV